MESLFIAGIFRSQILEKLLKLCFLKSKILSLGFLKSIVKKIKTYELEFVLFISNPANQVDNQSSKNKLQAMRFYLAYMAKEI